MVFFDGRISCTVASSPSSPRDSFAASTEAFRAAVRSTTSPFSRFPSSAGAGRGLPSAFAAMIPSRASRYSSWKSGRSSIVIRSASCRGLLDLVLADLDLARGELVGIADLVGPLHGVQHDRPFPDPQQAKALTPVPRELRHATFEDRSRALRSRV